MAGSSLATVWGGAPDTNPATLAVPGSKSYSNRALVLGALTPGPVELVGVSESDDSVAMLRCLDELGIRVRRTHDSIVVAGDVSDVAAGRGYELDAGLAGTTIRFVLALSCIVPGTKRVFGLPGLNARPIAELVQGLTQLGADIGYLESDGHPPLEVRSARLIRNAARLRGDISSQYFSALLMIAPAIGGLTIDVIGEQTSKPYIDMTMSSMAAFGVSRVRNDGYHQYVVEPDQTYRCSRYAVEGDWSCAGYFLALAALTRRTITVQNLNPESAQADRALVAILERMGNSVTAEGDSVTVVGRGVAPLDVDMNDCPDQIQTVAVLAAFADGVTRITGARTLRDKETDRLAALEQELARLGIVAEADDDTLLIHGGQAHAALIKTYGDHRMAMSFAIAGARLPGMMIEDHRVVAKSYPEFWDALRSVGVRVDIEEDPPS